MRVLIYGGGSVGLGIGSCLIKSGVHVDILARKATVRDLQQEGLTRRGIFGEYVAGPAKFSSFTSLDDFCRQVYDYVLVCTKSFDSAAAAEDILRHSSILTEKTKLILFQNGWGNAQVFSSRFDDGRIYNARVITGFQRVRNNEVTVTVHADPIHVGSLFSNSQGEVEDLCRMISEGDIPCETTDSIEKDLWAKMLYNCALNPLGAILNVPYGALAEQESARDIMRAVIEEVFDVMDATGLQTHWRKADDFIEVFYGRLVPDTAGHRSSMLQDIAAGKKTEIDALNGAVIALAGEHHIRVPYNSVLYNMVKFAEARGGLD